MDKQQFVALTERLVNGLLREAIGYRVESSIPYYRGVVGYMVETPMLWIRHSRFPVLFIAFDPSRPTVLQDVVKQLEIANAAEFFALLVVVPTGAPVGNESEELRHLVADSVYRHDFVVLDRDHLSSIIASGTSERLVEIILNQGIELSSLSPYVVKGPVPEKMFFGREKEIKTISQTIQRGNYAVVGGRRIGKSSTLLAVKRLLAHDSRYRPVYLNCEDKFDYEDFFQAVGDEFSRPFPGLDPNHFRRMATELSKEAPAQRLVFLLDEVDELLSYDAAAKPAAQLFKTFRSLAHEEICRFVFSGSRALYRQLRDSQSPFFNFVEHIQLKPLEEKSVAEIVTKPLQQLGLQLPDQDALITRLFSLTAGHPNLVQWLCDQLLKRSGVRRRITLSDLEALAADPEFHEHFVTTAWGEANPLEKLISIVINEVEFTADSLYGVLSRHGIKDRARIRSALEVLEVYSVLECRGLVAENPMTKFIRLLKQTGSSPFYHFVLTHFPRIVRQAEDVPSLIPALVRQVGA
jgi:AAA+ ATPase superfamily predicted ATPase